MKSAFEEDTAPLSQTFHYQSTTHSFTVKWSAFGDATSPPLIFIHGTPWSSRVWVPFALALSRKFHVYLFDRAGFGESPPERKLPTTAPSSSKVIEFDGDLSRQSEVYAALFKSWESTWDNKRPHVVAHDNAGLVTLRAHLLHDCQYASLCLIDVVAIGPFGKSLFKAVADEPHRFHKLPDSEIEDILQGYIRDAAFYELSEANMKMLKSPWLKVGGREGFLRELSQANFRSTEAVEARYREVGLNMPVKIIWGAEDSWIPAETAWRLGNALKAKEVVVIEKAGHLIMFDQGAQLGVELGTWLSTVFIN